MTGTFTPRTQNGFSLLELLIVVAIMMVLAASGIGFYRNYVKTVEIQSTSKMLASDLRQMRSKAMIGEESAKWGAHVVNVSGGDQYYVLFSTLTDYAAGTALSTTTLPLGVTFSDPAAGASKDIIFSKISGMSSSTSIILISEGMTQMISITSIGSIN